MHKTNNMDETVQPCLTPLNKEFFVEQNPLFFMNTHGLVYNSPITYATKTQRTIVTVLLL